MPHVIVKMYPGRSEEQKDKLAQAITQSVIDIANTSEDHVSIDIQEIADSILIDETITFEGTASDDIEVILVELSIGDDDPINITSEYLDGSWSYEWNSSEMTEGDLTITVGVTDIVGKQATDEITIKLISYTTDTDEDGMPDWWENKYSLNPEDNSDAAVDLDGDGRTNLHEYLNNTNPTEED